MSEREIMDELDLDSLTEKFDEREEYLLERISDLEETNDELRDTIDDLKYDLKLAQEDFEEFKAKIKAILEGWD